MDRGNIENAIGDVTTLTAKQPLRQRASLRGVDALWVLAGYAVIWLAAAAHNHWTFHECTESRGDYFVILLLIFGVALIWMCIYWAASLTSPIVYFQSKWANILFGACVAIFWLPVFVVTLPVLLDNHEQLNAIIYFIEVGITFVLAWCFVEIIRLSLQKLFSRQEKN